MVDITYLIIGLIAGLLAGGLLIYLLPYRTLRDAHGQVQTELADAQARNNELQSVMLEEQ